MNKKFYTFFSVLILVFNTVEFPIHAQENEPLLKETSDQLFEYRIENNEITITQYLGTSPEVVIPATIEGLPVTDSDYMAYKNCTSITFSDGIEYLPDIRNCKYLKRVVIPKSVKDFGNFTLQDCYRIEELIFKGRPPEIHLSDNGDNTLTNSMNIIISVPANKGWETSRWNFFEDIKMIVRQDTYQGDFICEYHDDKTVAITGLKIPQDEISIPLTINGWEVTSLNTKGEETPFVHVTLPHTITTIGPDTFSCQTLQSIEVDTDNEAFASQDGVLFDSDILVLLRFPPAKRVYDRTYFVPWNVHRIEKHAFENCKHLKSIILSPKLHTIDEYAFSKCEKLASLTIPSNVEEIHSHAFDECPKLTSLVFLGPPPQMDIDRFTFPITFSVPSGRGWETQKLPEGATLSIRPATVADDFEYFIRDDHVEITGLTRDITELEIPETISGKPVTFLHNMLFYYYSELTSIVIPGSIEYIPKKAFKNCISLTSVTLENGMKYIDNNAFEGCESLKKVVIPDSVRFIGKCAFKNCTSLESIVMPDELEEFGEGAFVGCKSLTSIKLPKELRKILQYTFTDCSSLASIDIPKKVSFIGGYAFYDCVALTSIHLPSEIQDVWQGSFKGCKSLKSVDIDEANPNFYSLNGVVFHKENVHLDIFRKGITKFNTKHYHHLMLYPMGKEETSYTVPDIVDYIASGAFSRNSHLTTITLPDSVMDIDSEAFEYCTKLETITIPINISTLPSDIFQECTNLKKIIFRGMPPECDWEKLLALTKKDKSSSPITLSVPANIGWEEIKLPQDLILEIRH